MNEAVSMGAIAMLASMGLIVVIALVAAGLLSFFEKRIDHGDEH
ncbi:hypothetical protein SAMN02745866_01424 [Alteromonadaceae bacterium Bs31]|nr:hypothetical protein SAMN02745866_01424 [Alteromonadaceae bacterium Bs31]